jgi:hypothetical protein
LDREQVLVAAIRIANELTMTVIEQYATSAQSGGNHGRVIGRAAISQSSAMKIDFAK